MQALLVEVTQQDQIYVEDVCTREGYSISAFFVMLLNQYREAESEKLSKERESIDKDKKELEEAKKAFEAEKASLKEEKSKKVKKK